MMNVPSGGSIHSHPFPAGSQNSLPANIPNLTAQIVNGLTSYNIESMVMRFREIPFLGNDDKMAVAAKMVFEKAIEDIHSSPKFVTFIHLVCKKQRNVTEKRFKELIQDLCFQNLQYQMVGGANNRRASSGTLQLLGELFVLQPSIYHKGILECVDMMMMSSRVDDNLQDLCQLLTIVGKKLDEQLNFISERVKSIQSGATYPMPKYVPRPDWMAAQFEVLKNCAENKNLSTITRKKLQDLIRLKESGWEGTKQNESNPPPISKSFQAAFPSSKLGTPSLKSSRESVASNSCFEPTLKKATPSTSTTSLKSNSSEAMSKTASPIGSSKSQISTTSKTVPKPIVTQDLSNLEPEDAMVEILKTLDAGNVPAVTLKITNLPFADNFERMYAMVRNMLDKSERDPSFLTDLQTQTKNEPPQPDLTNNTLTTFSDSSPPTQCDDKETQTSQKSTVDAQVATDVDFAMSKFILGQPEKENKSSLDANSVTSQIETDNGLTNLENGNDLKPDAQWQKMIGSLLSPPPSVAPPALKYLSMYSNYDRMLEKLCEEDAEDLNMEICNLIFQRLKLRKGKLDAR